MPRCTVDTGAIHHALPSPPLPATYGGAAWRDLAREALLRAPGPQRRFRPSWVTLEQLAADAAARRDQYAPITAAFDYAPGGTASYYPFLAGLADVLGATRVLEIGTFHGGSARALASGMRGGRLVTLDVEPQGIASLAGHPIVRAFQADATSLAGFELARAELDGPVDRAFVDGDHDRWETMRAFMACQWLGARIIVFDDIDLNDEMRAFWRDLGTPHRFAVETLDLATIDPSIRPDTGMGLARLPRPRFR